MRHDAQGAAQIMTAVREVLAQVLSLAPDDLSADTDLAASGWDSMAMLETIVALEARLGSDIDLRLLRKVRTAADLCGLLRSAS